MDKLLAGLKSIGVEVNPNAEAFEPSKLAKIVNNECNRFCMDDTEASKNIHFVEYMHQRFKEKYASKLENVNLIFSGLIAGCKKYYKTTREMRLYLQLMEKDSFGTKASCLCYMKLRKFLFESLGKKVEHDVFLQGIKVPPSVVEGFAAKMNLDVATLKAELVHIKADLENLDGPEFALAVMKVFNNSKSTTSSSSPAKKTIDYKTLEDLEKYKKSNFAEKVFKDQENNLGLLTELLFKLHSDGRFNDRILTSVTGRRDVTDQNTKVCSANTLEKN